MRAATRSNTGIVHALPRPSATRAACGTIVRASWDATLVHWPSEPRVCRLCDDVVMARGRKAAW